jgi:hypothetical protein
MPDRLHDRVRAEIAEELQRRDLAAWMRAHRAEMAAMLADGEMDWNAAAAHFRRAGLLADERPVDATSAEAAWRRVTSERRR